MVAVAAHIASNSPSVSTANTVPRAAKRSSTTRSGGYIAVGPIRLAVDGSGTALVTRVAGQTSSDALRNESAETTLITRWSERKCSSERALRATRGLTAITTVSQ